MSHRNISYFLQIWILIYLSWRMEIESHSFHIFTNYLYNSRFIKLGWLKGFWPEIWQVQYWLWLLEESRCSWCFSNSPRSEFDFLEDCTIRANKFWMRIFPVQMFVWQVIFQINEVKAILSIEKIFCVFLVHGYSWR